MIFFILTCILTLYINHSNVQAMFLGKADVEITSVELCPGSENDKYTFTIARHKIDRTTEGWSASTAFDDDDDVMISLVASMRVDGGYKETYQLNDSNPCEFLMKNMKTKFTELLIKAGIPPECPVPPGSYAVDEFVVGADSVDIDVVYGEYRLDAIFYQDGRRVFCLRVYCLAKPKNSMNMMDG